MNKFNKAHKMIMEDFEKVDISDYGTRYGWLKTFNAGEGKTQQLHIPSTPSMKHAFMKMLYLIYLNPMKTRKEILDFYNNDELIKKIFEYGNSFTPFVDHYWSDLFRLGYIQQYRNGKDIVYDLTDSGKEAFTKIPDNEQKIFRIIFN